MDLITKGLVALAVVGASSACNRYQSQPIPVRTGPVVAGIIPFHDTQRVAIAQPPYYRWREGAEVHGLQRYLVGSRSPGSLPRQGTHPGTTRAVEPSQGTIRYGATPNW
jgi:hypothetical protein